MQLERNVAVKVLKTRSGGINERQRAGKEALALSRLNHPNIESIYSIESDGDIDFLVFELLSGCTLPIASGPSQYVGQNLTVAEEIIARLQVLWDYILDSENARKSPKVFANFGSPRLAEQ